MPLAVNTVMSIIRTYSQNFFYSQDFSIRVLYCSTRLFIIAHAHYAHCTWELSGLFDWELSGLLDMALSIMKMGPVLFGSIEDLIAYLQGKGLLASNKLCPNCSSNMTLQRRSDIEDKFRYMAKINRPDYYNIIIT